MTSTNTVAAEIKTLSDRLRASAAAHRAKLLADPNTPPAYRQRLILEAQRDEAQRREEARQQEQAQQSAPTRTRKRRPSVSGVIRQMKRAGVDVAGCEVQRDGTVRIISGKPVAITDTDINDTTTPDPSEWN